MSWRVPMLGVLLVSCTEPKRRAPANDETVSVTLVSTEDGGTQTTAVVIDDAAAFPLPYGDVPSPGRAPQLREPGVYVVELAAGDFRPVYLGTVSLFFGPRMDAARASAVTFLEGAKASWVSGEATRVSAVVRERARREMVPLLFELSARADQPAWHEAFAGMPLDQQTALAERLYPALVGPGASPDLLAAVLTHDPASGRFDLARRVEELAALPDPPRLPLALLLRALTTGAPERAAPIACQLLASPPRAGDPLLGAALLGAQESCTSAVQKIVERDACTADARCSAGRPLGPRASSAQDEPTCSSDESVAAADAERARSPWQIVADPATPTTALAIAALGKRAPPARFVRAQAQRRYAIEAPAEDAASCSTEPAEGTACVADEAELRHAACTTVGSRGNTGSASFTLDGKTRTLRDVRRSKKGLLR